MSYTICIPTFSLRKKLLENLVKSIRGFVDIDIILGVNGNANQKFCNTFRRDVLNLCSRYANIYPVFFPEQRGLSKIWNTILTHSTTDWNLVLNDDVEITSQSFDSAILNIQNQKDADLVTTMNIYWSHFIINKKVFEKVGYFDERYLGFGQEDSDFRFRFFKAYGHAVKSIKVDGIKNSDSPTCDSGIARKGKYSKFNSDHHFGLSSSKYALDDNGSREGFPFTVRKVLTDESQYCYETFFSNNKHSLYE